MGAIGNYKFLLPIIFATVIPTVYYIYNPGMIGFPTVISSIIYIICFAFKFKWEGFTDVKGVKLVLAWFAVLIIGLLHSIYFPKDIEVTTNQIIISALNLVTPCFIFLIIDSPDIKCLCRSIFICYIPTAIISYMYWEDFLYYDVSHIMLPFMFLLLISPYFSLKWQITCVLCVLIGMFSDLSVRSCVISYTIVLLIFALYYIVPISLFFKFSKIIRWGSFIMPLIFLLLGYTGQVNIFTEVETSGNVNIEANAHKKRANLMLDTRTGIYEDVLRSIDSRRTFLFGRGCITSIKTSNFAKGTDEAFSGRKAVESGILNIFIYYGLFGCIIFFALIFYATYLGIYRSRNAFTIMAAIFLCCKFVIMFVEESSISFLTYIAIGICLSEALREKEDAEILSELAGGDYMLEEESV